MYWSFLSLSSFFYILISSFFSGWMFLPSGPHHWSESQFPSHHYWFPVHFSLFHLDLIPYFIHSLGLSNELSFEAGIFSCCCSTPTGVFSQRFKALFPLTETLGCGIYLAPQLFFLVYLPLNVGPTTQSSICHLSGVHQLPPCHESSPPGCPSIPLLPVWMSVSSLTPWLSDFHTVQFSVSSGCFLFLYVLLSFFWLFDEAQWIYLCLHVGWKWFI